VKASNNVAASREQQCCSVKGAGLLQIYRDRVQNYIKGEVTMDKALPKALKNTLAHAFQIS